MPRRILLLREDELAVTGNGKVKIAGLRQLAISRLGTAAGAAA